MRKYLAFSRIAFQQELAARGGMLARFSFYVVILLVFSFLWKTVNEHSAMSESEAVNMIWYLAFTEWIVCSIPLAHFEVEKDVKSGDIAYRLCRPVSYLTMRVFEGFGVLAVRMSVLGVAGFFVAWYFSGSLPERPLGLVLAFPLGLLAGVIYTITYTAIGLSAFWVQEATPVYWIWQKLSFILGGLILPLSIYPPWLQKISLASPFSYLLYRPAQTAVSADLLLFLHTLIGLLFWGMVIVALMAVFYARGKKILQVNGG